MSLYLLSLIGSGAGFMTQMLVSGYWATAFSNDIFYYSINLAFYLLALGIGSLLSNRFKHPTFKQLGHLIIGLLAVTGFSIPFLKWGIGHFGNAVLFPIGVVTIAGVLNGLVVPLTLRIGVKYPRMSLGTLFFIDYSAATLFAFLFTFVFLIPLGYSKTALLISISSTLIVTVIFIFQVFLQEKKIPLKSMSLIVATLILPTSFYFGSGGHVAPRMDRSGVAKILHNEQSHYQKIVLTEETSGERRFESGLKHVLFLDGFVQFSTVDEKSYHFCLVDVPVMAGWYQKQPIKRVLILGGGDGLAARNLLNHSEVEGITLVELDPSMIKLARENAIVREYNKDSLRNPKVEVIIDDAFRWVQENQESLKGQFDLILIDFPAPKNLTLARLFAAEFYRSAFTLLKPNGWVSIQAGPSYSFEDPTRKTISEVTASILKTVESINYHAFPYVTPQDSEAFVFATQDSTFDMATFSRSIGINTGGWLAGLCRYDKGWKIPPVEKNTLNTLRLSQYMLSWFRKAGDVFFYYRGNHLVLLPD